MYDQNKQRKESQQHEREHISKETEQRDKCRVGSERGRTYIYRSILSDLPLPIIGMYIAAGQVIREAPFF